jgi:peptide/nickel transport system substrate-binding protein
MPDAYPLWHSKSAKLGGFNLVNYKNEKVDELIEKGSGTINKDELGKFIKRFLKLLPMIYHIYFCIFQME